MLNRIISLLTICMYGNIRPRLGKFRRFKPVQRWLRFWRCRSLLMNFSPWISPDMPLPLRFIKTEGNCSLLNLIKMREPISSF
jgi:hypothetical protein